MGQRSEARNCFVPLGARRATRPKRGAARQCLELCEGARGLGGGAQRRGERVGCGWCGARSSRATSRVRREVVGTGAAGSGLLVMPSRVETWGGTCPAAHTARQAPPRARGRRASLWATLSGRQRAPAGAWTCGCMAWSPADQWSTRTFCDRISRKSHLGAGESVHDPDGAPRRRRTEVGGIRSRLCGSRWRCRGPSADSRAPGHANWERSRLSARGQPA